MKTNLLKTMMWGSLLAAGWAASGSPLQRADVPAEPAWVLHLDCDGLRPTVIGQYLLTEMEKPEAQAKLAAFESIFSFDLRKQLHGLTLYSTGTSPQDGVLLVYADFQAERLVTLAKAAHDSRHTSYREHVIYNWIDDNKKEREGVKPRVYAAIQGTRVIFGQREERVARALDVLDGGAPNLSTSSEFSMLGAEGETSFLEGAARKLDLPEGDPNAAIFRLAKQIRLQMSEAGGQATARLTLEANDEEIAGHMATIAQGLVALLKLQKDNPESARLADGLALKQDGPRLVASLALPSSDVVAMMKADAARKAARKAQREREASERR